MLSCTLVALSWLEQIHREDIMRGKTRPSKFSWLWRCPLLVKKRGRDPFWQCTARWPEGKVITDFFLILQLLWSSLVVTYTKMIFFAGYGNIVPKTVQGRLFCVLYALIGIPGTCLTLKSIGDKITELFTKLITNFEKRVLKRSHQTQKVELKVAMTTIVVTVLCLLPLMGLLVYLRHKEWSYIEVFTLIYFHDFEYNWFWWLLAAI